MQPVRNPSNPSAIVWPENAEFVSTVDGLGYRTGNRQEKDVSFFAPERQEAARYTYGVVSLADGVERFYYPRMISPVSREEVQVWLDQQKQLSDQCAAPASEWDEFDL